MVKFIIQFLIFFSVSQISAQQIIYHKRLKLMGSRFDLTLIESDSIKAKQFINLAIHEITRIEKVISSWNPSSETSTINKNAGIKPVRVSKELFNLIKRSLIISKLTDGAFDISFAAMDKIWKFDGTMKNFPTKEEIEKSVEKVGYKNIVLNENDQTVFLRKKGMKIGFGAIGKGYAADTVKKLLISKGVPAGIINASGDMNTWGKQLNGEDWKVAITNPLNKNKAFALLPLTDGAVVTSGNYEKFIIHNNKRYTHIIDPRTGYPASGILSVTVFSKSAELADALATSVFVMGVDTGLYLINQLPDVDCVIVDERGKVYSSKNIKIKPYE